jgi:glycosyltransferase involved in cell wall biosynthesis
MVSRPANLVSVIVTSHTRQRLGDVFELLRSLKFQTYPNVEVIFVGEKDPLICEEVAAHARDRGMPNVRVLFNDGEPGLSAARNVGIREARGEDLAFLDDDAVASPDWAEEVLKTFASDDSVIGVTGPVDPLWDDESMVWLPREFYWLVSCTGHRDWNEVREVRNVWGVNMAFAKEAFERCGLFRNECGYHKGPFPEDNEFSLRVRTSTGKRIVYNPMVRTQHRVHGYRLGWRFIAARSFWIGLSRMMLKKAYGRAESGLLQEEETLRRRILTRLLPSTVLSLTRHPLLAARRLWLILLSLSFMALGYGSGLFRRYETSTGAQMARSLKQEDRS